jgi:hypothetical protein
MRVLEVSNAYYYIPVTKLRPLSSRTKITGVSVSCLLSSVVEVETLSPNRSSTILAETVPCIIKRWVTRHLRVLCLSNMLCTPNPCSLIPESLSCVAR